MQCNENMRRGESVNTDIAQGCNLLYAGDPDRDDYIIIMVRDINIFRRDQIA